MTRYQALADDIEASITAGVLRAGDKLPSVRHTSERRGVSASTVFQAYYLLEARGLVRARERSGYFVAARPRGTLPQPTQPSAPAGGSFAVVDVSERVFEVLESAMDRDVVPLGSAFPSPQLFPLRRLGQCLAQAAREADPRAAIDDLTPGSLALRRQIARRALADGMALSPPDLVITNGALEALNLCLSAVTRPGGAVVIESPCFYGALQALERMGLSAIEVPTHPGEGMDLAALETALQRHKPQAIWLMTSFQNPLGCLMPEARKKALVELATRHCVPLIEDDVYGELYFGEHRPPPAKAFDTEGWVLHCASFSKSLAPGWRIGWAAPGRFARAVARQKLTTTLATNAPTQQALARYLESGGVDRHLRRLRQTLALHRDRMADAIARHFPEGTQATRPEGGYFMWVQLPQRCDALALHRQALAHGISVAPGPIFSASQAFGHCLRLNYGHPFDESMQAALATLGQLARQCISPRP
ncbi:PLP-dependent aminotransferase family protein [Delftia sp. PS-11]|uniref:aminotransferase-like domain-containing protein n=1 Tax=Delftia sp. PS-11 TaxID=2767222 RepID=UPI002457C947|nr:PLP-dependent aminotransferase family protein [Delftia sp. PS-11]KAJ8744026.1 PLP-dependent aminotransferase family protein [Delftia sp. PS-11]